MTLRSLLLILRERGIQIAPDLDNRRILWHAPKGRMTPDVLAAIRQHKSDLILLACLVELGAEISEDFNIDIEPGGPPGKRPCELLNPTVECPT